MKKNKLLSAIAICTMIVSVTACGASKTEETSKVAQTEMVEVESTAEVETETETAETETEVSEETMSSVLTTTATYVKDSEFASAEKLVFSNESMGEFICNISPMTMLDAELIDGNEYVISHSPVMTMSLPGILSQVYSIRSVESDFIDTKAELIGIDEGGKTLLFSDESGYDFLTEIPQDVELIEGDQYIVTHDSMMTRSMPGMYTNVTRIFNISN